MSTPTPVLQTESLPIAPPHDQHLEQRILGAMLVDKDAQHMIFHSLRPEHFYFPAHQTIFAAAEKLFSESKPIDYLVVADELKRQGKLEEVGGLAYLAQLAQILPVLDVVEEYINRLIEKYIYRRILEVSMRLQKYALSERKAAADLLDEALRDLTEIIEENIRGRYHHIRDLFKPLMEKLHQYAAEEDREGLLVGIGSGFPELDRITGGWRDGELIVLAARPGMGKSAFALALARHAALEEDKHVAIFSMEMSGEQLMMRLVAMESYTPLEKIVSGNLTFQELADIEKAAARLVEAPIWIDETAGLTLMEFKAMAMMMKVRHQIDMIIVDYLQLMSAGERRGTREQEVSTISRTLKMIAKELNIPIIAVSQLSRQVEQRSDLRPRLSDLRESGAIEQDADMVIFLYRPEYHGLPPEAAAEGLDPELYKGYTEVIVAKHRNGRTGTVALRFNSTIARFEPAPVQWHPQDQQALQSESASFTTLPSRINEDMDDWPSEDTDRSGGDELPPFSPDDNEEMPF